MSAAALSRARRVELLVLLGALAGLGPVAMDMYFPALPTMARSFGVHSSQLQLTLTTFLIGVALGQVVAGALSDVHGRKRPLLVGVGLYVAASIACALTQSIAVLVAARFVQGCCASFGVAIGRAVVRDVYAGPQLSRAYARLFLVIGMAPVVAPSVGAFVLHLTSWRGIFVVLACLGALLFVLTIVRLPETLPPERRRGGGLAQTVGSFGRLTRDPRFLGYATTVGMIQAVLVVTLAGAPFVIQDHFGLSAQAYGFIFLLAALGMVVMNRLNGLLLRRASERRLLFGGCMLNLIAGLGVVASSRYGLAAFVPAFVLVFATWGLVPANAIALAMRDYASTAGAAAALMGVLQYGLGAFAAPLAGAGGNETTALGVTVLALAAVAALIAGLTIRHDRRRGARGVVPI